MPLPLRLDAAEGSREGHHVNAPRASCPKRRGRGGCGRSGRVDVVDEGYAAGRRRGGAERAADAAALGHRRATLPTAAHALEERLARELPEERELAGETLGGVVAALEPARAIGRDERERVGVRAAGDVPTTSAAASAASRRRPRSFQLWTKRRAASS